MCGESARMAEVQLVCCKLPLIDETKSRGAHVTSEQVHPPVTLRRSKKERRERGAFPVRQERTMLLPVAGEGATERSLCVCKAQMRV